MNTLWPNLLSQLDQGDDSRCAVSAKGVRIRFADNEERLCMTSGLWNVPLGYGNKHIANAIAQAAKRLSYGGVFRYENIYAREAADTIVDVAGRDRYSRVLFSTGGGPAVDLALKLARQYQILIDEVQRRIVVGLQGSFHGLVMDSFPLTGEKLGQEVYGVDRRLVRHIPANDVEALSKFMERLGDQIAAVILEPVAGSGTRPLTTEFIDAVLQARDEHGFLLIADEVATGFARTGPMFASSKWSGAPDIMLLSKALSNGSCAISAVLVAAAVSAPFVKNNATLAHAETAAGNSIATAAVTATLEEMMRFDIVAAAARTSVLLDDCLRKLVSRVPGVEEFSGVGAFRTVHISYLDGSPVSMADVLAIVDTIRSNGVIVHPGVGGIQLVPALVYTANDMAKAFNAISCGINAWRAAQPKER